jgi:GNAT superfamily N-acetyltransferase
VILLRQRGRLVGAVRAQRVGDSWEIGRLMVAPDLTGKGIGRWLLAAAERLAPADTTDSLLFTGAKSTRNIRMYQRAGYILSESPPAGHPHIRGVVYLLKPRTT